MELPDLAFRLASAAPDDLPAMFAEHRHDVDLDLARELKTIYDDSESSDPALAAGSARALESVAGVVGSDVATALSEWVSGMAALDNGALVEAIDRLESARQRFLDLNDQHSAASTQVSRLIALAILGRYDEAIETGTQARDLFLATGDDLAAGKIEQNLGNIDGRRERHAESEEWFRSARDRYARGNDQKQLAQIDNCLATALKWQHQFREAESLYQQALQRAEAEGLDMTRAEIEDNLGLLTFFQGRYDEALDYLERSRRRFAGLNLPHETAYSELEMAEVYLDLGLLPEVLDMTGRSLPVFEEYGMRAEAARAWLSRGRALRAQNRIDEALAALDRAGDLFAEEENRLGGGMVTLARAELLHHGERFAEAHDAADEAERIYEGSGVAGRMLLARWLRGESLRELDRLAESEVVLTAALDGAREAMQPEVMHRAETSLGLVAATAGDLEAAEAFFLQAIEHIETLRAPLPAEDFRAAFLADRLRPYSEMVRLCLASDSSERLSEALEYVEHARSRVLVDQLAGGLERRSDEDDPVEQVIQERLEALREDLNWFYRQINRLPDGESLRGATTVADLQSEARDRERAILELQRQISQRRPGAPGLVEPDVVARLQAAIDIETTVVEYFSLDDEYLAFVIKHDSIQVVRNLGSVEKVRSLARDLRFQLDTLRYGQTRMTAHMEQLTRRAQRHLRQLYDMLFRDVEPYVDGNRVVIIPHRTVHYVPFQALVDGGRYLVERYELSYAPSTGVLLYCLNRPERDAHDVLIMGVPDERIPRVQQEVESIARLFSGVTKFEGEAASLARLRTHAPQADVIHLACHGYFRQDNPHFSSLQLGDGWLNVRDAGNLRLDCSLVTLSACETGVSDVAPGDELIGLARGFLSAGAPSVLVSLWTVDDDSTSRLMQCFYEELLTGVRPAKALQSAQMRLLEESPHPFYWSPFVLVGRW